MKLDFWQLSRDPADKVTALIASRVLGQDERLLVVSADAEQRAAISLSLWGSSPTRFLANGQASEVGAERHPILLSETPEPANGASHVIFADGRYRDIEGFDRAFLLFDDTALQSARQTWKALEEREGLERAFFRQDGGKWVKVA